LALVIMITSGATLVMGLLPTWQQVGLLAPIMLIGVAGFLLLTYPTLMLMGAGSFAAAVTMGAGLDADVVASLLADPFAFESPARVHVVCAVLLEIRAVPFSVLKVRCRLSGPQPAEVFEQAPTQVYDELNPKPASPLASLGGARGVTGGIDGC